MYIPLNQKLEIKLVVVNLSMFLLKKRFLTSRLDCTFAASYNIIWNLRLQRINILWLLISPISSSITTMLMSWFIISMCNICIPNLEALKIHSASTTKISIRYGFIMQKIVYELMGASKNRSITLWVSVPHNSKIRFTSIWLFTW
jgi:hypothetical protein